MYNHARSPGLASEQAKILVSFGLKKGLSIEQCLDTTNIAVADFNKGIEVNAEQELTLINNIISSSSKCPFALGYAIGFNSHLNSLGIIGHSILTCGTLLKAIGVISRYLELAFHFVNYRLNIDQDHYRVTFELDSTLPQNIATFILARDMGVIFAVHCHALGEQTNCIQEIGFTSKRLPSMQVLEKHFNSQIKLEQGENYFIADANNLKTLMPLHNPVISKLLEALCHKKITPQQDNTEITHREKVWIYISSSKNLHTDKDEVASKLNMSTRTLSRHLEQEGTSWRELIYDLRMTKAENLLIESNFNLLNVSEKSGFSSAGSLSRAFTRKHNMNPTEYRQRFRSNTHLSTPGITD